MRRDIAKALFGVILIVTTTCSYCDSQQGIFVRRHWPGDDQANDVASNRLRKLCTEDMSCEEKREKGRKTRDVKGKGKERALQSATYPDYD